MANSKEFEAFIDECREVGLADVKAMEAVWEQFAVLSPESTRSKDFREKLMNLLKAGAELARFEDQVKNEEKNHG